MTFASPIFFWAFLSLIPLVAVYFLKVRPRRKPTTAYFLWEKIFQEKRTSSLFRRLRDFWSLLLMILAFSAAALALTGPQWTDDEHKDVLILIDHSASMSARHGNASRLDEAKATASEIVRAFDGAQRAAVASVGHDLVYRSHLTDNPRELLDAIDVIPSTDYSFRPSVLSEAETESKDHRVILITDGCFDCGQLPRHVELLKVGKADNNIGIVAADLGYVPGPGRQLGFYFQIASTHDKPVEMDLLVSRLGADGTENLFKVIPLQVDPGVNSPQVYTLDDAEPGRWIAKLDLADSFAKDDIAYLAAQQPRPVRVAVQSDDRFFLENSVVAFSRGAGLLQLTDQNPQIVLAKAATPDAKQALIFQPAGESAWWTSLGDEVQAVAPRLLVEDHPALRFVDVTSIPFIGARQIEPCENAKLLVVSDEGVPLVYRASRDGKSAIVVNMDPVAAEFYFSAWFPVLVHSAATHLAGREESLTSVYRPSDVVMIPGVGEGEATKVSAPAEPQDRSEQNVVGKKLPPLSDLGFYELNNKSGDWLVACSLLSASESLLDNAKVEDTSKPIRRGYAPAHLLTLLAILVLTIESLLYHRRKVG